MVELADLEQRIKAALDRIGAGMDAVADAGDATALKEALDAEKMANAQLEERLRALKESQAAELREIKAETADRLTELEAQVAELTQDMQRAKSRNRTLKQSNQRLLGSLQTLRDASAEGIEPHLINHALMSEVEALQASRSAEKAELDEILGALKPMLEKENTHA